MARFAALLLSAAMACGLRPAAAQDAPSPPGGRGQAFIARFQAANTTHDGRLTLAQAEAAHMMVVVRHFAEVDTQHRGYITLGEIRAYRQQRQAAGGGGGMPQE